MFASVAPDLLLRMNQPEHIENIVLALSSSSKLSDPLRNPTDINLLGIDDISVALRVQDRQNLEREDGTEFMINLLGGYSQNA